MHYFEPIPLGEPTGINPPLGHVYVYYDSSGKQHTKMSNGSTKSGIYSSGSITNNVYTKFNSAGDIGDGLLSDDGSELNTAVNLVLTGSGVQEIYATDGTARYGLEVDAFSEYALLKVSSIIPSVPYFGGFYATTGQTASIISNSPTGISQLTVSPSVFEISSNITGFTGLTYAADYSADYTNRSLVDKGYVDGKISGGTLNYLAKFDGSGGLSDSVIFDDGTNAGAGTGSPTARYHIKGSTNDNSAFAFKVDNSNNTNFFNVRNDGAINVFGGSGFDTTFSVRQRDFAYIYIMDIYNSDFSKLCFRATDNGSSGQVILGHGIMTIDNYTGAIAMGIGTGSARLRVYHMGVGGDVLAVQVYGGNGSLGVSDDGAGNPVLYLQDVAGTSTQVAIRSAGTSYIHNGGDLVIGDLTASAKLNVKGNDTTSGSNSFLAESSTAPIYTIRNDHTLIYQGISSGFTGSEEYKQQAGVQTTNATTTNIATIATSNGQMIVVKGVVSGFRSDATESYGATFFAVFYNNAGTLNQIGTTDIVEKFNFSGTPTIVVDLSSTTIRIRVTGEVGKTINWTTTYKYQKTITNS